MYTNYFTTNNNLMYDSSSSTASSSSSMSGMSSMGMIGSIFGAINSIYSTYNQAQTLKQNLEFQSKMSALNARAYENAAQGTLMQGQQLAGQVGLKAGQAVGSQKASQGARGIQIGVGSAAEEVASTNLAKEMDMITINANAVRQAGNLRIAGTNYSNQSLLQGTMASSINPLASAGTTMLESATKVADSWMSYRRKYMTSDLGM